MNTKLPIVLRYTRTPSVFMINHVTVDKLVPLNERVLLATGSDEVLWLDLLRSATAAASTGPSADPPEPHSVRRLAQQLLHLVGHVRDSFKRARDKCGSLSRPGRAARLA